MRAHTTCSAFCLGEWVTCVRHPGSFNLPCTTLTGRKRLLGTIWPGRWPWFRTRRFITQQKRARLAKEACSLTKYSDAAVLDTLAVSYAEAGDYAEAIAMTDKAIDILTQQQRPQVVTEMQRREQLYIQHKTYHPAVVTEERPLKSMLDLTPRN